MQMIVGGRDFDLTKAEIESMMRGRVAESIQKYVVEINGTVFPPKQVLGDVTGWTRTSFTTMEAQRVLTKLGFVCREARNNQWVVTDGDADDAAQPHSGSDDRLAALEAAVATAQERIAGLAARVQILEANA